MDGAPLLHRIARRLGSGTLFGMRWWHRCRWGGKAGVIPCDQPGQIVAEWPVGPESLFIKKALNTASHADLIGMTLRPHRPTHFSMPAAASQKRRCAYNPSRQQSQRPQPTRLLFLSHNTIRKSESPSRICAISLACNRHATGVLPAQTKHDKLHGIFTLSSPPSS